MTTDAIEAWARAMKRGVCLHCRSPAIGEGGGIVDCDCPNRAWDTPTDLEKVQMVIEAAIASGELVPASAVAAERERCIRAVRDADGGHFTTKAAVIQSIRSLPPGPASGEYVVVPVEPTQEMIDAALALDSISKGVLVPAGPADVWTAMLNAATKDGKQP